MDYRGVLLTCTVFGAGVLGLSSGCKGPDPGAITFAERAGAAGEPQGTGNGSTSSGSAGATSSGTSGTTPVGDTIFGAAAFNYVNPGVTANAANAAHANTVEGKNCIVAGCHLGGNKPWLFGGTIYTAANGGVTVPKAEIRIIGPDNTEVGRTFTDGNGNYWLEAQPGQTIPAGSFVGVRKEGGTMTMKMATPISNADAGCSENRANCHGATQGKVYAQ
jgi:hypothetical protein